MLPALQCKFACACLGHNTLALRAANITEAEALVVTFALAINFLEKTLRDWKVMLLPMAARKPGQLKVTSDVDARATPPTTGSREATTARDGDSPRNRLDSSTLKKGSIAYAEDMHASQG